MITLRKPTADDFDLVFRWENTPELWKVSEQTGPFTVEDILDFHARCLDDTNHEITRRLICLNTIPIGAIDIFDFDKKTRNCGLGIFIADNGLRRKGHATEALRQALQMLQDDGCHLVKAIIYEDNTESVRLFSRAGFTKAGGTLYRGKPAHQYICTFPNEQAH